MVSKLYQRSFHQDRAWRNNQQLFTEVEVKSGGYLPSREAAKEISITFNDNQVNNCFSIYHTDIKKLVYFFQYIEKCSEI